MTTLVIQTSFLGDMVLTTPLIAALGERGPVDVVGTPAAVEVLANNPRVRRTITYDKRGRHRGLRGLIAIGWELRAAGPLEAAFLAQGSVRSALLARVAGARELVGFDTSAGRFLYTRRVRYREHAHHAERLWRLAVGDDAPPPSTESLRPRLYPGAVERERVDRLLRESGWAEERLIALAPGSNWQTKRWPYYPELAARIGSRARVAIIGGAVDAPVAAGILERAPSAIDLTGRLSVLGSAELVGRSLALVTNDSAPLHVGSAMNTPTLAIFGPTVPAFGFGPLADRSLAVGHTALACRPCDRHGPRRCPLGHWRCMRELSADAVYQQLTRLVADAFR